MELAKNEPVAIAGAIVTLAAIFGLELDVAEVAAVIPAAIIIFGAARQMVTPVNKL